MALFQTDGWDIKTTNVAVGGISLNKRSKKDKKRSNKERKIEDEGDEMSSMRIAGSNDGNESKEGEEGSGDIKFVEGDALEKKTARKDKKNVREGLKKRKHESLEEPGEKSMPTTLSRTLTTELEEYLTLPLNLTLQLKLTPLQQKMMAKLSGSRFRWINEQLYTITSEEALQLMKEQPGLFDEYHQGFRSQVQSWPENPVDVFVEQFKQRAQTRSVNAPGGLPGLEGKEIVIADMGCGEAQLALDIQIFTNEFNSKCKHNFKKRAKKDHHKRSFVAKPLDVTVHSFDLKKANDRITVADIKNVPLPDDSCSIVVFCLALMGTNFLDFVNEAYRLLAPRGELWIAEIKSRFTESAENKSVHAENVGQEFVNALKLCGFFHKSTDNSNKMFTRFEFFKPPQNIADERNAKLARRNKFVEQESEKDEFESKRAALLEGNWLLKPCIYKRR